MPVRTFFPFAAIEDTKAGVCWGAQLAWHGSWQIEVARRDDFVSIGGGLADREFGHWMKTVEAGASFTAPAALLSCVDGDLARPICLRLDWHELRRAFSLARAKTQLHQSEALIFGFEFPCEVFRIELNWGKGKHFGGRRARVIGARD